MLAGRVERPYPGKSARVHIETTRGHVVHPRLAADRQVERRAGIGGAVHHDGDAVALEVLHALGALVTDEDLRARPMRDDNFLANRLDLVTSGSRSGRLSRPSQ